MCMRASTGTANGNGDAQRMPSDTLFINVPHLHTHSERIRYRAVACGRIERVVEMLRSVHCGCSPFIENRKVVISGAIKWKLLIAFRMPSQMIIILSSQRNYNIKSIWIQFRARLVRRAMNFKISSWFLPCGLETLKTYRRMYSPRFHIGSQ